MKKRVFLLLVLCLSLCCSAFAETTSRFDDLDLTIFSDEELDVLSNRIKAEQRSRLKTKIVFDPAEITVAKGKNVRITAEVTDLEEGVTTGKFSWSSSDEGIAACKNGTVSGKNAGAAVITCTTVLSDGTELFAELPVAVIIPVQSVQAAEKKIEMQVKDTCPFNLKIKPDNATNTTFTYESSDSSVASVNENGVITGMGEGKAKITAVSTDGTNKSASVDVTVEARKGATDREILYQNIPWGSSIEEANAILMAKYEDPDSNEARNEKIDSRFLYANSVPLSPKGQNFGLDHHEKGTTYYIDQYQQFVVSSSVSPDRRTVLGHQINQIEYAFAYGYENGTVNPEETHLYSVHLSFHPWEDGQEVLKSINKEFGAKPLVDRVRDPLSLWAYYWWSGEKDTALMMRFNGPCLTDIWYFNTRMSDEARERIENNKTVLPDDGI